MRGRPMRIALTGLSAGILLVPADAYFGNGDGRLGYLVLGALLLGSLLIEFSRSARLIRHPRSLDLLFVAGASRERRTAIAVRDVLESARLQPMLPCIAALVMGIAKGNGPGYIAVILGSLLLESALVGGVMVLILRQGMLPVSTERFPGSGPYALGFPGSRPVSLVLAPTYALARRISGFLGAPHGWLLRRRLLHVFRVDPVFNLIYAGLVLCLGGALAFQWNAKAGAAFSVVGTLLTLTLVQTATAECDARFREAAYLFPGAWEECRSRLALYLAVAAAFSAFYAVSALSHGGISSLPSAIGFLHTLVTCLGFPFLLLAREPGRARSMNGRILMNACFLGLAGSLFLFGGMGFGAALAVLAFAVHGGCRVCGRDYWRVAAPERTAGGGSA